MTDRVCAAFCAILAAWTLEASAVPPENSAAVYKKGAALAAAGKINEAIPLFEKAVKLSPYSCLAHYGLGRAYLSTEGKLDLAVKHLNKSVELDKSFARGYFYLGLAYFFNRNYIQAVHSFDRAYREDYTMIEALYNMGVQYDLMDNGYKAAIYFNKYLNEKYGQEEDILFR